MKIFFYRFPNDTEVPFKTLYEELSSGSELFVSNYGQFVEKFETYKQRITNEAIGNIIENKTVFIPISVREIFLGWYPDLSWLQSKKCSDYKFGEILGADELNDFLHQVIIEEEWEGISDSSYNLEEKIEEAKKTEDSIIEQKPVSCLPNGDNMNNELDDIDGRISQISYGVVKIISLPIVSVVILWLSWEMVNLRTIEKLIEKQTPSIINLMLNKAEKSEKKGEEERVEELCDFIRSIKGVNNEKINGLDNGKICFKPATDAPNSASTSLVTEIPKPEQKQIVSVPLEKSKQIIDERIDKTKEWREKRDKQKYKYTLRLMTVPKDDKKDWSVSFLNDTLVKSGFDLTQLYVIETKSGSLFFFYKEFEQHKDCSSEKTRISNLKTISKNKPDCGNFDFLNNP